MARRSARLLGKRRPDYCDVSMDERNNPKRRKVEKKKSAHVDLLPSSVNDDNRNEGKSCGDVENSEEIVEKKSVSESTEQSHDSMSDEDTTRLSSESLEEVSAAVARIGRGNDDSDESVLLEIRTSNLVFSILRRNPLPPTVFTESEELWNSLMKIERNQKGLRDADCLNNHPELTALMRSTLFNWLSEVSEVFRLHNETFYLALDYVDRYLSATSNLKKSRFQLVGTTALFLASKYEEIYPRRLCEFSDLADGSSPEESMLQQEGHMLKALRFRMAPVTPHTWFATYLQAVALRNETNESDKILENQFSRRFFLQSMRLLDLCMMDVECIQWPYSILAAGVLCHCKKVNIHAALDATGFEWHDVESCVHWMEPFVWTLDKEEAVTMKHFSNISEDDTHNIHIHSAYLELMSTVSERKFLMRDALGSLQVTPDVISVSDSNALRTKLKAKRKLPAKAGLSSKQTVSSPGKENKAVKNSEAVD